MAPPSTTQSRRPPLPFSPLRCICIIILSLILLAGLIVLIVWLAIRPRKLVYTVESAAVHGYNLTDDNRLTANFNFTLKSYNPNKKISINYDSIEVQLYFGNEQLALATWPTPFRQPRRNATRLPLFLPANDVMLYGNTARDFKNERSAGKVELVVKVKAKVWYGMGKLKSNRRKLKVICNPTLLYSSKSFKESKCDVDM